MNIIKKIYLTHALLVARLLKIKTNSSPGGRKMASILYLSTDEGIVTVRSENGSHWKVEGHALQDWSITEAAVLASAPNRVFAGTRGDGVWLSEDFGKNWKKPSYGKYGPGKVRCITIDSHDPTTLYAGAEPIDVFVSRDSGKRWIKLDSVWNVPWVESVPYPGQVSNPTLGTSP